MPTEIDALVIGGGIAGLAAAKRLRAEGLEVTVLEKEAVAGGRMRTVDFGGAPVDVGAEEFTSADTAFAEIAERHDLEIVPYYSGKGLAFDVMRDGVAHPVDFTDPMSMLRTDLLSLGAKARLLRLLPTLAGQFLRNRKGGPHETWRAADVDDQSLEEWLGTRNPEFLNYVAEPIFSVVCGWKPAEMGRGWFAYTTTAFTQSEGVTCASGLGTLARALASELDVRTGCAVTSIDLANKHITFEGPDGPEEIKAQVLVIALPGHLVGPLCTDLDPARRRFFDRVRYSPGHMVYFALKETPHHLPQTVFWPLVEDGRLSSMGRGSPTNMDAPLLRVGLKPDVARPTFGRPADEIAELYLAEVARLHPEIPDLVVDRLVFPWDAAIPFFGPGYVRAIRDFVQLEPLEGVAFAGDYLVNPSTAGAHVTGERAADQLLGHGA